MTEDQFMQAIIDTARLLGWMTYHTRDSRGSTPGFPDLVLCRDRLVHIEVKSETGRVTPQQAEWIAAINQAGGTALIVRPSQWDDIVHALKRRTDQESEAEPGDDTA